MDTEQECNLDSDGIPLCRITEFKLQELNDKIRSIGINGHKAAGGRGSLNPVIMFIGEALGENEELQRSPFVGRAGQVLNEVLDLSGLANIRHYITNVVKIRPLDENGRNRQPRDDEVNFWAPYLEQAIELLHPRFLVGLGAVSTAWLLGWGRENVYMGKMHGHLEISVYLLAGEPYPNIMPCYHPAATFHRPEVRDLIVQDLKQLRSLIK